MRSSSFGFAFTEAFRALTRALVRYQPYSKRGQPAYHNTGSQKRFEKCILHIGTEKTGTTTIQSFLGNNRASLARQGILYPSSTGLSGGSQWGFAACVADRPWENDLGRVHDIFSKADQQRFREGFIQSLQIEFDQRPFTSTLLISSEHFHSRLATLGMISALKAFLDPWVETFQIILYLRRQDRVAVSLHSTALKSGNTSELKQLPVYNGNIPYYYNYDAIYENWSTIFGKDKVNVRLFDKKEWAEGCLIADFCQSCEIELANTSKAKTENRALNLRGAQFIREINRQMSSSIVDLPIEDRATLVRLVSQLCEGKHYPVSRGSAIEFCRQFDDVNGRVKQKILPDRSVPLFDDDFSDYPEQGEARKPRYEDAVALAVEIWRVERMKDKPQGLAQTLRSALAQMRRP